MTDEAKERQQSTSSPAPVTTDDTADQQSHPAWCDRARCTWSPNGGAHHSAWIRLGPLPNSGILVRAYLYATDAHAPLLMLAFHTPIDHPEDIANNAGIDEDTLAHIVLPPDQVLQLTGLLSMLVAVSKGMAIPDVEARQPR